MAPVLLGQSFLIGIEFIGRRLSIDAAPETAKGFARIK